MSRSLHTVIKGLLARLTLLLRPGAATAARRHAQHQRGQPLALAKLIDEFATPGSAPDVLYMGDSVVERVSRNDRDPRSLGEMVSSCLDGCLSVAHISRSGYHMGVFRGVVRALAAMPSRPRALVFPVNMRSFSPQWDHRALWQFREEISALERYAVSPLEPVTSIIERDESDADLAQYHGLAVHYPMTAFGSIGEFREIIARRPGNAEGRRFRLRQIFLFHYMYPLVASHRRIEALQDALSMISGIGVSAAVYITPVNYQAGIRYVGGEFQRLLRSNVAVVCEATKPFQESGRVRVLDWSEAFDSARFFHQDEATEHLNEVGRMNLARAIADTVRESSRAGEVSSSSSS